MKSNIWKKSVRAAALFGAIMAAPAAIAEAQHGISMYGAPALPQDFVSLPYANPDAPKGGSITLGNTGGFDSLNPFVRKGTVPWQLRFFTHETLLGRSWNEPFALYGLLAESVETPDDRSWVEFTLNPAARFSDGSPVRVDDVIFSFELLGTKGHPKYHSLWKQIDTIAQTGPGKVRITFNTDNRELALLAGLRPILSRTQWEGRNFAGAGLAEIPLGTGPYIVKDYEAGRRVTLERNPDYWGRDLGFRKGTHNLDEIKIDFYGDSSVLFEAFKAGEISAVREFNAQTWQTQYDFPAASEGKIIKSEIVHQKPSGMTGFVMNTRREIFSDWRVRQAMIEAFNFEYINDTLTGGAQPRITSYFSNSVLAMQDGPAPQSVRALLAPFADTLAPETLSGYVLPQSDGSLRNRKNIRRAVKLLADAGWTTDAQGVLRARDGRPLVFDILLAKGNSEHSAIANIYTQALSRLGVDVQIEAIDDAQYTQRVNTFDFDMTPFRRSLSLSPGNEQKFYWGSLAADQEGSRNLMGAKSPAIDAMIEAMLNAKSSEDFTSAARALDRVLTAGRYVIPFWQYNVGRIAHDARLKYPQALPMYGDGPNFMPEMWWFDAGNK